MNGEQQITGQDSQPVFFEREPVSTKKRNVVIGIVSAVAVLILSVGVSLLLRGRPVVEQEQDIERDNQVIQQTQIEKSDKKPVQETVQLQPEDVIAKIKDTYAERYTLLDLNTNSKPGEGEMSVRSFKRAPPYKVDGYDFFTDYDGGAGLHLLTGRVDCPDTGLLPCSLDVAVRSEVVSIYVAYGLIKSGTRGDMKIGYSIDVYTGKGLICTIDTPAVRSSSVSASCGLISEYSDSAARTKPFIDALGDTAGTTVLTNMDITDSQIGGYQKAMASISDINHGGGARAMFYRKNPGEWRYFNSVQSPLLCSDYDTLDLRSAFKGESCLSADGGVSAVQ